MLVKAEYSVVICAAVIAFLLFGIINGDDAAKAQTPNSNISLPVPTSSFLPANAKHLLTPMQELAPSELPKDIQNQQNMEEQKATIESLEEQQEQEVNSIQNEKEDTDDKEDSTKSVSELQDDTESLEEQQEEDDEEKNNDDKNDDEGDTPLEFEVPIPFP